MALTGCTHRVPATFPATGATPAWPLPPDPPRIRYVGEISGVASLGRTSSGLKAVGELLTGTPEPLAFVAPAAVAVSGALVYVADPSHPTGPLVHRLDLERREAREIRQADGAPLVWPIDVAARPGQLAIADARRAAVFVLDETGRTAATLGRGLIQRPVAVAWSASGRELWVLDAAAHALLLFDADGTLRARVGRRGTGPGEFNYPAGLAVRLDSRTAAGPAYAAVADSMNFRVQFFDAAGQPSSAFGRKGDAAGDFSLPRDAAFDSHGHLYVLDSQFENVQIFDAGGRLLLSFGGEGGGPGQFSLPAGITIDAQDRIWIADTYNRRVQVFQYLHVAEPQSAAAGLIAGVAP